MKKIFSTLLVISSLLLFAGCGGGSSDIKTTLTPTGQQSPKQKVVPDYGVNKVPIATFDNFTINKGSRYDGQLTATDADGDMLKYVIVLQPQHGTVVLHDNGCFTYTPNTGYQGTDTFSYKASDDMSSCAVKTVTIDVCKPTIQLPTAPTNLTIKALSPTKLELSWIDNSNNEEGFVIYRDGKLVAMTSANVTKKVISCGLKENTTYSFSVKAKNVAGTSTSTTVEGKTKEITSPPVAPTELKAKAVGETCLRLEWKDNADNESSYEVYQDGVKIKTISAGCHCVTVSGLSAGTTYSFVVKAVNRLGSSSSNSLSVKTKAGDNIEPPHAGDANSISGTLLAEFSGADVYVDFGDGNFSTKTKIDSNGKFKLDFTDDDMAIINPDIPEGADGPRSDLVLVVEKDGKKLRNVISRDLTSVENAIVSYETEAYIEFLESIGMYDIATVEQFDDILDDDNYTDFLHNIAADVRTYFLGGVKLSHKDIFDTAYQLIDLDILSDVADDTTILPQRDIMSGGTIVLPVDSIVVSEIVTLTSIDADIYRIGNGSEGDQVVYLQLNQNDIYNLLAINLKAKQVTQIAKKIVTPQQGADIESNSIGISIPPFALSENKELIFTKIYSEGETSEGKLILDMKPSGMKFDLPITIKINYAEYGVDDPYGVQWIYGSMEDGYDNADIVSVDRSNQDIYLSVSHFSTLAVKTLKSQQYLDLGYRFVVHTPRRDHATPYNQLIKGKRTIISNKLFTGASISTLNGEDWYSGGQCVQYAKYLHYPLKYGKVGIYSKYAGSSQATNIAKKIKKDIVGMTQIKQEEYFSKYGIRKNAGECKKDDIVAMWLSTYRKATGHIAIYDTYHSKTKVLDLINSNYYPKPTLKTQYPYVGGHHERFGIGRAQKKQFYAITQNKDELYSLKMGTNRFVCLASPDTNEDGVFDEKDTGTKDYISFLDKDEKALSYSTVLNNKNITSGESWTYNTGGISVTHKPWLYYLVQDKKDGVSLTKKDGSPYYGFQPDLLPVTPLKINGSGTIVEDLDSRYEIYVNGFNNNQEFRLTGFRTPQSKEKDENKGIKLSNTTVRFSGMDLIRLEKDSDGKTEFKMIPKNGVINYNRQYELRTNTSDTIIDKNKKVLFSPTIIDDYYINWGTKNDKKSIPIGFWNSYGYDLKYAGRYTSSQILSGKKIYKSTEALNGYFMTLKANDEAEWNFALAGKHAIFVHVPTGDYKDIENATYTLLNPDGEKKEIELTVFQESKQKLPDSAFDNWFVLYEKDGSGNGKDKYAFTLTGDETLKVSARGTTVVDAIRLQGKQSLISDITLEGQVTLSDTADIDDVMVKVKIKNSNGKTIAEFNVKPSELENIKIPLGSPVIEAAVETNVNFLDLFFLPMMDFSSGGKNLKSVRAFSSDDNVALAYKPEKMRVKIPKNVTVIKLPKVILQKYIIKDNFIFNVVNNAQEKQSNVNIDIKSGLGSESELVGFTGITDTNGAYTVSKIPYGQYTATINKDGYNPQKINFIVDANTDKVDIVLNNVVGSSLDGTWVSDSNYVPGVPAGKYKTVIDIKKIDNTDYIGKFKSITSWYTGETCGLMTSIWEGDFTVEYNSFQLLLTFTKVGKSPRKECSDGSWIQASFYEEGDSQLFGINKDDNGIVALEKGSSSDISTRCGWTQDGVCVQNMPLFQKE